MIFAHFAAELDEAVKKAKQDDTFDEGVVDVRGESITIAAGFPATLCTDKASGVDLIHHKLDVDRGISYERACQIIKEKTDSNTDGKPAKGEGFWQSGRPLLGREKDNLFGHTILIQKPVNAFALNPVPIYKVYRPGTGLGKPLPLREFTRDSRYKPLKLRERKGLVDAAL